MTSSLKVTQGEGQSGPVAIAMFDNVADTDDELSFSRGELLMVICVDYEGMEGWWMCASMNEQRSGLVPANRVRLATSQEKTTNNNFVRSPRVESADYDVPTELFSKNSLDVGRRSKQVSKSAERPMPCSATDYDVPTPRSEPHSGAISVVGLPAIGRSSRRELPRPTRTPPGPDDFISGRRQQTWERPVQAPIGIRTERALEGRDSVIDDYDVPRYPVSRQVVAVLPSSEQRKTADDDGLGRFIRLQTEILNYVAQIKSNASRWRSCNRNASSTLPSLIHTMCTSLRRKLLVVIATYVRCLATTHTVPISPDTDFNLSNLVELIRLSTEELDTIGGRCRSRLHQPSLTNLTLTVIDNDTIVGQLVHVAEDVSVNLGKLMSLAEHNTLAIDFIPTVEMDTANSPRDVDTEPISSSSQRVPLRQTSTTEDGRQRLKARSTPAAKDSDYDSPKAAAPSSITATRSLPRELRRPGVRPHAVDDLTIDKRVAIVIDRQSFDGPSSIELLERRQNSGLLRVMPSKMITARSLEDLSSASNAVDYDIPVPAEGGRPLNMARDKTVTASSPKLSTISNPFQGGHPYVDNEVEAIRRIVAAVKSVEVESQCQGSVDNIRALIVASFRVVYIGDAEARRCHKKAAINDVASRTNELSHCVRQLAVEWRRPANDFTVLQRTILDCSSRCLTTALSVANVINLSHMG